MAHHVWVELKMTPLEIEQTEDGTLMVYATEAAMEIATEEARHACWFCYTPLDADTYGTECPGGEAPPRQPDPDTGSAG